MRTVTTTGARISFPIKQENVERSEEIKVKEESGVFDDHNQVNNFSPIMMSSNGQFLIARNTNVVIDEENSRFWNEHEAVVDEMPRLMDRFEPMIREVKEEPGIGNYQVNYFEPYNMMSFDEEYMRFWNEQDVAEEPLETPRVPACKVDDKITEERSKETAGIQAVKEEADVNVDEEEYEEPTLMDWFEPTIPVQDKLDVDVDEEENEEPTLMDEFELTIPVQEKLYVDVDEEEYEENTLMDELNPINQKTKVMTDEECMNFHRNEEMIVDDQLTEEASIIEENEPGLPIDPGNEDEDVDELQVYKKKRSVEDIEEEEEKDKKKKPRPADNNNTSSIIVIENEDFPEEVRSKSAVSPSTTIVIEDGDISDDEEDKEKPRHANNNNLSTYVIDDGDFPEDPDWLLVGRKSVVSLSTTRGMKLENNEIVYFTFPDKEKLSSMPASSKTIAAASNTVRFSTKRFGQIGKLKPEWSSLLISLVSSSKVKICGRCIAAPMDLSYYQDINLYVSFYINRSVFTESDVSLLEINPSNNRSAAAVVSPLMKLFNCLKIKPSTNAISTPGDLSPKKCVINTQKQALHWMTQVEKGMNAETLHPFWEEYKLCNEKFIYVNTVSGEATTQFPKSTSTTRGGILVDATRLLRKADLMIGLLSRPLILNRNNHENCMRNVQSKLKGGTLVICPTSVFIGWKDKIEARTKTDATEISVYFCGYKCTNDPTIIRKHDVVVTSYTVVTEAFRNDGEDSIFQRVEWERIILDESHTIKVWKTMGADGIFNLSSESRWCLTGSSNLGNNLEDVYNHLRFLRIEPVEEICHGGRKMLNAYLKVVTRKE